MTTEDAGREEDDVVEKEVRDSVTDELREWVLNWRSDDRGGIGGGAILVLVGNVGVGVALRDSEIGSGKCSAGGPGCAVGDGLSAFLGDPYRPLTGDLPLGGLTERCIPPIDDLFRDVVAKLSRPRTCTVFGSGIGVGCSSNVHNPSGASVGDAACGEDGDA